MSRPIYLDENATSSSKIDFSLRSPSKNLRSDFDAVKCEERLLDALRKEFEPPFEDLGVIVTSGATEALNVAVESNLWVVPGNVYVDPTSHNASYLPLLIGLGLFQGRSPHSKVNPIVKNMRIRRGLVLLNLSSSFVSVLPHHDQKDLLPDIEDSVVIIDASQYIQYGSDFRFLKKIVEENANTMIAFGTHKKLLMDPGLGFLLYNKKTKDPSTFRRKIVGGLAGGEFNLGNSYGTGPFPAGTWDYRKLDEFMRAIENHIDSLRYTTPNESIRILDDLLEFLKTQDSEIITTPSGWCVRHPERSLGELNGILTEYIDVHIGRKVVYRSGRFCCDYYFETQEFEHEHHREGFIRFSVGR